MFHRMQGLKAEYLIAQYMEDVFRREVRNIGVFVRKGESHAARFFGETEPGLVDGRKIKSMAAPEVYRQWIQYWRRVLSTSAAPFDTIRGTPQANYLVIDGGDVLDTGHDSAEDIANFLYSALVAEGGFAEAYAGPVEEERAAVVGAPRLGRELELAFVSLNILAARGEELPLVRHPVIPKLEIKGTTAEPHRPQFAQQNGRLYVMESVDFTDRAKERARDHAGFASFMFDDLREVMGESIHPIAVVRVSDAELSESEVRYGLSMLHKTSAEVVNWLDAEARRRFIEERQRVALLADSVG